MENINIRMCTSLLNKIIICDNDHKQIVMGLGDSVQNGGKSE